MIKYIITSVILIIISDSAYAYLDPATGGALIGIISAAAISTVFFTKQIWYKFKSFSRLKDTSEHLKNNKYFEIVIHAEGENYNRDFRPILSDFDKRKVNYVYYTSDINDPLLNESNYNNNRFFIGESSEAFSFLNNLSANIFISTTPGLDVLQLRRSKYVKHYIHLLHSPGDISFYKTYSFDYYDSILTCGSHQTKSLRFLEELRNTKGKNILQCGCIYYDFLCEEVKKQKPTLHSHQTILIAPTWGANGLLSRGGEKLIHMLVEVGFHIIIRPHPQSLISEKKIMKNLQNTFLDNHKVEFDLSVSSVTSMVDSCILISDLSGIILDFAFLFDKPIIVFSQDIELNGLEANDLVDQAWELDLISEICIRLEDADMDEIQNIVKSALTSPPSLLKARDFREKYVVNFGNAAPVATDMILEINSNLKKDFEE